MKERKDFESNYPLLILSGEKDIELIQRLSKRWYNSEPTSKYHIIRDAGHCANMDNPDEFNSTLMTFIKGNK